MELNTEASGASESESGAQSEDVSNSENQTTQSEEQKIVDFKDHKRALDDMLKYKSQAREYQKQLSDYEARLKSLEEEKMSAEGRKDELLERYKQEAEIARQEKEKFQTNFFESKKYDSVYAQALKAGLREEAKADLDFLDLDGVEIEKTDQGRVLVHGAESFVEKLKQTRPHWFTQDRAPRINSGGATGEMGSQALTAEYMFSLEKRDPAKFKQLWPKFQEQRRKKRS